MSDAPGANPKARQFFEHARDAADKKNFDYALKLFAEALKLDPLNLAYRQAQRATQRLKLGNDPGKVGMLASARVQPQHLRMRTEKARSNWTRVLELAEDAFAIHPWDVGTAQFAAEAAQKLERKDLARWLMESVLAQAGDDAGYFKQLAGVYEWTEQYREAIACWEKVRRLDPTDETAKRQINALSASATIQRSGLSQALGRNGGDDPPASGELKAQKLDELRARSETPIQRLQREIEEDPQHPGHYLELADLLRQARKLDEAEKVLAQGRKALPEDQVLRQAHGEIQIARLRRAIVAWTRKVETNPDDPDAPLKLQQLREKLDAFELNELKNRVKLEPTNLNARLEFGQVLARLGKHDEAIAEFQQARAHPGLKIQALQLAGQSFEAKGLPKLAERQYQDALKQADADETAVIMALNYRLGRVYESMGDLTSAENHYNEVAANDYTYEDVAERLRALNQRR